MSLAAVPLVLASGSATRRALLHAAGLSFTSRPVPVDEGAIKAAMRAERASVSDTAMALADAKAQRVRQAGALVIGADQILVCQGEWFDKPASMSEARSHLLRLRGHRHQLVTAVTCWRDGEPVWSHLATPALTMRPFSESFLDAYLTLEGDTLLGSVGAYRLEGPGIQLFDAVQGEHSAILGLPMLPLLGFLRQHAVIAS